MSERSLWRVLRRRTIYESPWICLHQDTVQLPDGTIIEDHHVVDYPRPAAGVIAVGGDGRVLLIDHYRFITGTRDWEVPAGRVNEGEQPEQAAARELLEETGYTAGRLQKLGRYFPSNGSSNQVFHIYAAHDLTALGLPSDTNEVIAVRWFAPAEVRRLLAENAILDGLSLTALLWGLSLGIIGG